MKDESSPADHVDANVDTPSSPAAGAVRSRVNPKDPAALSARQEGTRSARRPRAKSARRDDHRKASSRKSKRTPRTPSAPKLVRDASPRRIERVASSTPREGPRHAASHQPVAVKFVPRLHKPALPSAATPRNQSFSRSASAPPDERYSYRAPGNSLGLAGSPSYRTPRELVTGATPRSYREQWTFRTPRGGSPLRPKGAHDLTTEELLTPDLGGVSVAVEPPKAYDPLAEVLADFRSDRDAFDLLCRYGGSRSQQSRR